MTETLNNTLLIDTFIKFSIVAMLGFLIGLERSIAEAKNPHAGLRDFVLFALLGGVSAYTADIYANYTIFIAGFVGFLVLLFSGYWADFTDRKHGEKGITTEAAAILTFFLGALVIKGFLPIAIALAIVILAVLSQNDSLSRLQNKVKPFELEAALKLLIITFIILPILPTQSLDSFVTLPMGKIKALNQESQMVTISLDYGQIYNKGDQFKIYTEQGKTLGIFNTIATKEDIVEGKLTESKLEKLQPGHKIYAEFGPGVINVMLSAVKPYSVWLIVILVSFISFIGYVLVKIFGSSAGIGLTGLVGGLASSTVTTLSFARRSMETPQLNRQYAIAIILASTIMFPRLLIQIAVVNQQMMMRMAVPILTMAAAGVIVALFYFFRARKEQKETAALELSNPFSLKSAITFALVFASILMITRLAISYLGESWLPLVALVSGLTDADAIAFSVSDAQKAGLISLDWAAFNVVLGATANTFMKLMLVYTLGDRDLFKRLLGAVLIITAVGLISSFLYYDFS